jgi:acyl-coenzyme A thioesterase PaaI-like protein
MRELPHTHSCFVCGEANPLGLKLRFESDGQIARTRFTPCPHHVGFKDVIHGGLLATVLDEIMVWACAVRTRRFAFCAEMSVRFLRSAKPQEELVVKGELVANRRGKIFEAKASVTNAAGDVLAEATGKYMPIGNPNLPSMMGELVGDWQWLLDDAK